MMNMYNDLVNISIIHGFSVAKLRYYFESCIRSLWKKRKQEENANRYKSTHYE